MKTMQNKKIIQSLIIIIAFLTALYGSRIFATYISVSIIPYYQRIIWFYSWWIAPVVLATGFMFGFKNIFKVLGLDRGFIRALVFAIICVSPMFLSSAIAGRMSENMEFLRLLHSTLFAGFGEEVLFRGFLFGILFRKLGWGFIPAALAGAIFFGMGHIYQGSTFAEVAGVFIVTAMGAAWFAWLYIEWDNNLWVPVFLHVLMNLSWALFEVSSNALGGFHVNIFRALTIALTIIITIKYHKAEGLKIKRNNLIVNYDRI
jgi:membrane protease YdiL (CAAX protease family)